MASREGEEFTHFISMEIKMDDNLVAFQKDLRDLQSKMKEFTGIGKASKSDSLHITIATIKVNQGEMDEVMKRTLTAFRSYIDLSGCHGINVTFQEIGHGDYGVIWLEISLGKDSVKALRKLLEVELGHFITDSRFHPHLTIFRRCDMSDEAKEGVRAAVEEVRLEGINLEQLTLRERKSGVAIKDPLLTMKLF